MIRTSSNITSNQAELIICRRSQRNKLHFTMQWKSSFRPGYNFMGLQDISSEFPVGLHISSQLRIFHQPSAGPISPPVHSFSHISSQFRVFHKPSAFLVSPPAHPWKGGFAAGWSGRRSRIGQPSLDREGVTQWRIGWLMVPCNYSPKALSALEA